MQTIEVGQIRTWVLGRDQLVPRVLAEDERPDANASEIIEDPEAYFAGYWAAWAEQLGCTFDVDPPVLDVLGNMWSRATVRTVGEA